MTSAEAELQRLIALDTPYMRYKFSHAEWATLVSRVHTAIGDATEDALHSKALRHACDRTWKMDEEAQLEIAQYVIAHAAWYREAR